MPLVMYHGVLTDMLLVIDVGNTNSVFALFDGETLCGQWRLSTNPHRTSDEYSIWLAQMLQQVQGQVSAAIIATVVPEVQFEITRLCRHYYNVEPLIVGHMPLNMNITVDVDRPQDVGADRLLNAVEAWKRYQEGLVVLDFGTATTFDVVSGKGAYIGGVIAPGVNLSLDALQQAAAKLPAIRIRASEQIIGRNTVSAMESGIYFGYVSLVEGVLKRIQQERPDIKKVIATGGLAPLYAKHVPAIDDTVSDLTIYGLHTLYYMNKETH